MEVRTREHLIRRGRPEPDEAELEPVRLSMHDLLAAAKRAAKRMLEHNMMMIASALAYSVFFAIPAVLLLAVGLFTLIASPGTIDSLIHRFGHVMPAQATDLLSGSLHRLDQHPSTSIVITVVGLLLAMWSVTGAMTSFMTAVNMAYGCKDSRNFVKKRGLALLMAACICVAFVLVAVLLMFGPQIEKWIGSALGASTLVAYVWWIAQWPILVFGLLAAFATILYLGPNLAA
jgi:membrane protein